MTRRVHDKLVEDELLFGITIRPSILSAGVSQRRSLAVLRRYRHLDDCVNPIELKSLHMTFS